MPNPTTNPGGSQKEEIPIRSPLNGASADQRSRPRRWLAIAASVILVLTATVACTGRPSTGPLSLAQATAPPMPSEQPAPAGAPVPSNVPAPSQTPTTSKPSQAPAPGPSTTKPPASQPPASPPPATQPPATPPSGQDGNGTTDPSRGNARQPLAGHSVVVDAGHGTYGSGASGFGSDEATNTLAISKDLRDLLVDAGAKVYMTRTTMAFPGDAPGRLDIRTNYANSTRADIFVSVHNNYFDNSEAVSGAMTFYSTGGAHEDNSRRLARDIQAGLVRATDLTDRGVETAGYYVTRNSTLSAAVLVEVGFLSNPSDATALADDDFREKAASGIAQGIIDYFGQGD